MEPVSDDLTDPGDAPARGTLQERFDSSPAGRAVISVGLLLFLLSIAVWNLPNSAIKADALPFVRPFVDASALDQNWSVFAPDPRRLTLDLTARIEFADGTTADWAVPLHREPFLTPYRTYRWQKWMEHVRADDNVSLWDPAAQWLARSFSDRGEVVRVRLIRHWYDNVPPGSSAPHPDWNSYEFHVFDVTADA